MLFTCRSGSRPRQGRGMQETIKDLRIEGFKRFKDLRIYNDQIACMHEAMVDLKNLKISGFRDLRIYNVVK